MRISTLPAPPYMAIRQLASIAGCPPTMSPLCREFSTSRTISTPPSHLPSHPTSALPRISKYKLSIFPTTFNSPLRPSSSAFCTMSSSMMPSEMLAGARKLRRFSNIGSGRTIDGMPSFAFAFDIDGVLLRSSSPIPGAAKALNYLHDNNIPFILLTNGGGKHESDRVKELSKKLGIQLTEDNFIQSHTPFKQLAEDSEEAESLQDKTILVTGGDGDKCRKVAEMYGFKNVVTTGDILMAYPTIWPFNQLFADYYLKSTRPLQRPIDHTNPSSSLKIDSIFVFSSPRDWALDSQIILDLLLSKDGVLGTYSEKNGDPALPNNGWQQDGQPKLFFSNPDLFWATSHHMPRYGQGGFQAALEGVWDATTDGATLDKTVIGKPHADTYRYAERVLNKYREKILEGNGAIKKRVVRLDRVFMVGDNPESDIRGANEFLSSHATEWTSILVESGVFSKGSEPVYKPKKVVTDVLEAVKWALKEEGWKGEIE